ncbi:MAG TPA: sigma-70 family RNA polymerase sigma factor [Frankiaceae bacterium]|nr:sigma-70 family RNA polymerase sigma factor [Frankiaceae bacterium]
MTIAALAPIPAQPAPRSGDDEFAALYKQYQPQLVRYVTHHFGPRDADEVTQEALTRALRALDRGRSDAETWAWLIRVARNVAHDIARSRRICDTTDDDAVLAEEFPEDAVLPEPAALLDERRRLVRSALKSLPATQRRILVLYEVDELPCPAIARLVGSNEYAVRKALQRARSRFAAEFRALGGASFGSVAFWFRGLGRRAWKAAPATSASTALAALAAGTLAIGVGVQAGPAVDLSPRLVAPVAVSSPEDAAVRRAPVAVKVAPERASRSAARPAPPGTAGAGLAPADLPPVPVPDIMKPGYRDKQKIRITTPVYTVQVEREAYNQGETGVVCSLHEVECDYEND